MAPLLRSVWPFLCCMFLCAWWTDTDVWCVVALPPVDRHLKHQSEISCRRPRCWRHMVLIHIRARFFFLSTAALFLDSTKKVLFPTFYIATKHVWFMFYLCSDVLFFFFKLPFSGCVWEPSLPRLHTVWFCGASGKQESSFSQMVSQMCNILLMWAKDGTRLEYSQDVNRQTLCCRPFLFLLIWQTCSMCRAFLHETACALQLAVQSQSTKLIHLPLPAIRADGCRVHRWLITPARPAQ